MLLEALKSSCSQGGLARCLCDSHSDALSHVSQASRCWLSKGQNKRRCCAHEPSTGSACVFLLLSLLQVLQTDTCVPWTGDPSHPVCPQCLGLSRSLQETIPFISTQPPPKECRWLGTYTKCSKGCCWGASGFLWSHRKCHHYWRMTFVCPMPDLCQALLCSI